MSAKTFTDRQGQYLAFIDAYTRVHAGPRPRAICSTARGQPAVCAPDGAYAGAPRARPPPAGRGAQHRGAPRPRGPACPTPPRTGQILCAGKLVLVVPTVGACEQRGQHRDLRAVGEGRGPESRANSTPPLRAAYIATFAGITGLLS